MTAWQLHLFTVKLITADNRAEISILENESLELTVCSLYLCQQKLLQSLWFIKSSFITHCSNNEINIIWYRSIHQKKKWHSHINYIFAIFRPFYWEPIIQNQIKTRVCVCVWVCTHIHTCLYAYTQTQTRTDTCCQGEGRQWKMQAWELWQLCPQRLASGPIQQPALHTQTHIHTHTHLPTTPAARANWALAGRNGFGSSEFRRFCGLSTWRLCLAFSNSQYLPHRFVLILIEYSWHCLHRHLILKPLSVNP